MARRLATVAGTALVAGATVLATSSASFAATNTWQITGVSPGKAKSAYIVSPTAKGVCVQANNRWTDEVGANITTIIFESDYNCTGGAGTKCTTTVASYTGALFDVRNCRWT
ncbi:hypothetical protein SGFS_061030 [Streptomyces graminofaciens]|uniref:Uncharacterized protein n=1 Tax=Streptomyces graminofaciens TaxID=68212 RepID=A0ABM7FF56_9ACTN|nr:hypothetical protein [Streptomyces graminofaciens]BBC34809.1 hypothetical protein SGFS_061030 [Streptomyces graminofaciens]